MPGMQNSQASGLYMMFQPVIVGGVVVPALTLALQNMIVGRVQYTLENAPLDTTETLHPLTLSMPIGPGAIVPGLCGPAYAVGGYSKKFLIQNKSALQSGTKKLQNMGNCPFSPMVSVTQTKMYCFVSA
jgi:hypothetical protein